MPPCEARSNPSGNPIPGNESRRFGEAKPPMRENRQVFSHIVSPGELPAPPTVPMPRMPAMATCWYCNSELSEMAQYCPACGHSQADRSSSPLFGVVDPVTGIWNSKFINALIGQEANRAIRYHRPLSV